jgi:hypothetical protein
LNVNVPSKFQCPPFRRWFTLTGVAPLAWFTVYGAS